MKTRFRKEVEQYNSFFGDFEQIKKIELTDHEWTVQSGELTANLKLKRGLIVDKFAEKINRLYNV